MPNPTSGLSAGGALTRLTLSGLARDVPPAVSQGRHQLGRLQELSYQRRCRCLHEGCKRRFDELVSLLPVTSRVITVLFDLFCVCIVIVAQVLLPQNWCKLKGRTLTPFCCLSSVSLKPGQSVSAGWRLGGGVPVCACCLHG